MREQETHVHPVPTGWMSAFPGAIGIAQCLQGLLSLRRLEKPAQGNRLSRGISLLMEADLVRKPVVFLCKWANSSSLARLVPVPGETIMGQLSFIKEVTDFPRVGLILLA